jgi:hypothetical protein
VTRIYDRLIAEHDMRGVSLGWATPAEKMAELLGVATTG